MTKQQALKLFEEKKVRTVWDDEPKNFFAAFVSCLLSCQSFGGKT